MPESDPPEQDPYTGRRTTGHEWNGITELDTPVPKPVWFFLIVTFVFALVMWILFPAWPFGIGYTSGVLGSSQERSLDRASGRLQHWRSVWEDRVERTGILELSHDPGAQAVARHHGARLYADNCAVCHGADASGGDGYPSLIDDQWLWGGDPESIMETLRVGINSTHEDTRIGQMPQFGGGVLDRDELEDVAAYVLSLSGVVEGVADRSRLLSGQRVFAGQCASCHGVRGEGDPSLGGPSLVDDHWIYGGGREDVLESVIAGRAGVMPHWERRLSLVDRKMLTLYLLELSAIGAGSG